MPPKRRCFRCHKNGHQASKCPVKHRAKSARLLLSLPVEIWEMICDFVIDEPSYLHPLCNYRLASLRLTCKEVYHRTLNYFARCAFKRLLIHLDLAGLERMKNIAQVPLFASKIQSIYFSSFDRIHAWSEYEEYRTTAEDSEASRIARNEALYEMRKARREQDERAFIDRSGADSIAVAMALQLMPNLQEIKMSLPRDDRPSIRKQETGTGYDATRAFSMLAASLPYAKAGLKTFLACGMLHGAHFEFDQGVSIQALALPPTALASFGTVQRLHLLIETEDTLYRNPRKWHYNVANFLAACPELRTLKLAFRNDWMHTELVFKHIVKRVRAPFLRTLCLDYIRLRGEDLQLFLEEHDQLKQLELTNLDITGSIPYKDILTTLSKNHKELAQFDCKQIAQNARRLYFRMMGEIILNPASTRRYNEMESDFFDDFVYLMYSKYAASVEEWENMQERLVELADDLRESHKSFEPEHSFGHYWWMA